MRVAIIGAGPAGITAAYQLTKANIPVDVYEAGSAVGGMAKTITLWNQKVDLGPHRFYSKDKRVNQLWLEVVKNDYDVVNRLTRIYYQGKFFSYPLRPFDALSKLGVLDSLLCVLSLAKERVKPTALNGSFENWVISRFGKRLYEVFFKAYSEKLWGISCDELDSDFAAQRIKKLSLFEAIKNAVMGDKLNKHKTLVDKFAYPFGGSGMVYDRMASYIQDKGGNIYLNTPIKRVIVKNKRAVAIELKEGEIEGYDQIISTMPLTAMVSQIENVSQEVISAAQSLHFRNTILVYLKVNSVNLFSDQWLYIQSTDLRTGRITNFRNWVPQLYGNEKSSIIAMEYWCYSRDPIWTAQDEELIKLGTTELKKIGLKAVKFVSKNFAELVSNKQIAAQSCNDLKQNMKDATIDGGYVFRIPNCYPVYHRGYKNKLQLITQFLKEISSLTVIGRYGAFKYNNQDHSMLMGILAAENIANGTKHDLWAINTDYEDYQESYVISKTGLERQ